MKQAFPDMPPPPAPPPVFSLADLDIFRAEMQAAGFMSVETDLVTRELTVESFDDYWSMMTAGAPPVQELLDRMGEGGQKKLRSALAEVVSKKFGDGPIVTRNTATMAVGTAR